MVLENSKTYDTVYAAIVFQHFSATEELQFLDYATWHVEGASKSLIEFKILRQFEHTKAICGNTLTLILQYQVQKTKI